MESDLIASSLETNFKWISELNEIICCFHGHWQSNSAEQRYVKRFAQIRSFQAWVIYLNHIYTIR